MTKAVYNGIFVYKSSFCAITGRMVRFYPGCKYAHEQRLRLQEH